MFVVLVLTFGVCAVPNDKLSITAKTIRHGIYTVLCPVFNLFYDQFKQNKADEYYTKEYAIKPLLKYIPTDKTIWCPFDKQESNFVKLFQERGNNVIFSHIETGQDFFKYEPRNYDYIVSNPPYSLRESILERLFLLRKPFAMLINEAGLFDSKKRYELLKNNRFEIMVFDKRIDYIKGEEMLKGVPFKSIFLCSNILSTQFAFEVLS